ncbi:MAG: M20/M25/M40 family metallo-hydrolase, partial [Candidatus Promineifilaceae bacterium]
MTHDVVELSKAMIRIQSVSHQSNGPISDYIQAWLDENGFVTERLTYIDPEGVEKVNIVGQRGSGKGGLAFFGHSDTVPGQPEQWPAFDPEVRDGRLFGRGSCDMKGQIAASMIAAAQADLSKLTQPVFVVVAADEETGGYGVRQVADESKLMAASETRYGVIIEPTESIPVYAHKGVGQVKVTAHGSAAHTSTAKGVSANFLIAPFMAEMAAYADELLTDPSYQNDEFSPPSNGFNMRINDG